MTTDRDPTEHELEIINDLMSNLRRAHADIETANARATREAHKADRLEAALRGIISTYDGASDLGLITEALHYRLGGSILEASKAVWVHGSHRYAETHTPTGETR